MLVENATMLAQEKQRKLIMLFCLLFALYSADNSRKHGKIQVVYTCVTV